MTPLLDAKKGRFMKKEQIFVKKGIKKRFGPLQEKFSKKLLPPPSLTEF